MQESRGKENEMLREKPLELRAVAEAEKIWNDVLANGRTFAGERDRWSFCASEVLYPDSLFFLGLNPSEPKGETSPRFSLQKFKEYGKIFNPLNEVAERFKWAPSYFDLFCVRRTSPKQLQNKLWELLQMEEGRDAVLKLLQLPRLAIMKAQPKAIYVCNGTVRNALQGSGLLAKILEGAGSLSSPFIHSLESRPHFCKAGGKNWRFYYTVAFLDGKPVPVLSGIDVGNQRIKPETYEELLMHIVSTFSTSHEDPEKFYGTLPKAR